MKVINVVDSCLHESKFSRVRRVKCGVVGAGERTAFTAKNKKKKSRWVWKSTRKTFATCYHPPLPRAMLHDKLAKLRGVGKSDFYNPTPIPSFKTLLINNIDMFTILLYSPTFCCLPTSCFHLSPLVTLPSNHSPPKKKNFSSPSSISDLLLP